MKKLFLVSLAMAFAFSGMNAQEAQAQAQPQQKNGKAVFEKDLHDFGTIKEENGPVTYTFEFTNSGTDPLLLKNVSASCGCTTPDWSKEPVLPGKKGMIKVTYNPANRPGSFEKTITIHSDGNPAVQTVKIKGTVEPKPVNPPAEPKK